MSSSRFVAALCVCVSCGSAQRLVKDINLGPPLVNPGSNGLDLERLGNLVLFAADDTVHGRQIWRTDGTTAGTRLATELPNVPLLHFQLWRMVERNGVLYFPCNGDPGTGFELWRSDGTPAGTFLVADIAPGSAASSPRNFVRAGQLVYFTADDGVHGEELWRTDGTAVGTVMVADLSPDPFPHAFPLTAYGSALLFAAGTDRELWITDGTTAGTRRVKDINPGPQGSGPHAAVEWNGSVYFTANTATAGYELWRTDGTDAGTVQVLDIAPGAAHSLPQGLVVAGQQLFFSADDGVSGRELWTSDGTAGRTRLVRDVVPGAGSSTPDELIALGTRVLFSAQNDFGRELWISDGSAAGTVLLADLEPGAGSSTPEKLKAFPTGSRAVFRATTAATGLELFVTDGTPAGTGLLADVHPGTESSLLTANNFQFGLLGNVMVFHADDGVHGREPWITDGTPAGTRLLFDVQTGNGAGSRPAPLGQVGAQAILSASDGTGLGLWVSDGTTAGTTVLAPATGFVSRLVEIAGQQYFLRNRGSAELWRTDGTAAGTVLVTAMPGTASFVTEFVGTGSLLFWILGTTLWVSDGTPAGTRAVRTFQPRPLHGLVPSRLTPFQGAVYLVAEDLGASEVWRSDGTGLGTQALTSFATLSSQVGQLRVVGSELFFSASTPAHGTELWVTDGTAAGTRLAVDLEPGPGSSYPRQLTDAQGRLFLTTAPGTSALWITDGTAAGTHRLVSFPANQPITGLTAFGTGVLFHAHDSAGREPWTSDGTAAGTYRIADVWPGPDGSTLSVSQEIPAFRVVGAGRTALFAADDGQHGNELWRTDGTSSGTRLVVEIGPMRYSGRPRNMARLGTTVLLSADDSIHGEELWAIPLVATGDSLAASVGAGCAGSSGRVPALAAQGFARLGNAGFALLVADARSNAAAVLLLGAHQRTALGACTLEVSLGGVTLPFAVGPTGGQTLPLPIPAVAALRGVEVFAQALVADPAGAFANLLAFSNARHLMIGD